MRICAICGQEVGEDGKCYACGYTNDFSAKSSSEQVIQKKGARDIQGERPTDKEIRENVKRATVKIVASRVGKNGELERWGGTGFILDFEGEIYIITNYHVVEKASGKDGLHFSFSEYAASGDNDNYPVDLKEKSKKEDVAVLTCKPGIVSRERFEKCGPLKLDSRSNFEIKGESVFSCGYPALNDGHIANEIQADAGTVATTDKTDGRTNMPSINMDTRHGNSGGPVCSLYSGKVVGIRTSSDPKRCNSVTLVNVKEGKINKEIKAVNLSFNYCSCASALAIKSVLLTYLEKAERRQL